VREAGTDDIRPLAARPRQLELHRRIQRHWSPALVGFRLLVEQIHERATTTERELQTGARQLDGPARNDVVQVDTAELATEADDEGELSVLAQVGRRRGLEELLEQGWIFLDEQLKGNRRGVDVARRQAMHPALDGTGQHRRAELQPQHG